MAEKNLKARIVLKHDTAENWSKASGFVPLLSELIVYEYSDRPYRLKIGNGVDVVGDLPFLDEILSDYAPINSPAFTGLPTAPTANAETYDNTSASDRAQIATCGFVYDLIYYLLGTEVIDDPTDDSADLSLGLYDTVSEDGITTLNSFNSSIEDGTQEGSHTLVLS